ncbi:related to ornithine decarboxylase [Serendipita indica DSM 11827]|uniref:ornithine decarboxylase n=1 Tax=Serendipita indica (strain DSM 11827) TaxID=1109443 RepID=G4TSG3_SERID|nr:related to ornithine decarboxylase [Serendipita indica DSM 11827]
MTAQVQSLPTNINFSDRVSAALYGGRPQSVATHARVVNVSSSPVDIITPNTKVFGMGLPSPPPERDEEGCLPTIHTEPVDSLLRSGIASAALAAAAHQPDAEAAFFVADLGHVYRQHLRWTRCLPNVTPFYAVKANPDPVVLRLLSALGSGFDCASMNEINMVSEIGVDPSRVIFANPCKPTSFVKHAARMGVDMTTFDNVDELVKIARVHPGAKLVLRILTDDSKSLCRLGLKFGASLIAVPTLLVKAKELGLNVVGISFHVGSGCYDTGAFADAVARAKKAFEMGREAGYTFTLLDVGGGFEGERFEEAAAVLDQALQTHFGDCPEVKIIAEPGRFYVSEAFTLAANIIARRGPERALLEAETDDGNPRVMYYLNDGVYGSFNCIMFDHQTVHPIWLTVGKVLTDTSSWGSTSNQERTCAMASSSLWGPTCDSIDCVLANVSLPIGLEVGDWLGFRNMGAYTICAASSFNGFDRTKVVYTIGDEFVVENLLLQPTTTM